MSANTIFSIEHCLTPAFTLFKIFSTNYCIETIESYQFNFLYCQVNIHGLVLIILQTISLLYFDKIRDDVTQRSLVAKRQMELKDMIIEDEVPDIG